jgi:hypothetical protein
MRPVREWRELAEWDWVVFDTGRKLHAVKTIDHEDDDGCWARGTSVCGRVQTFWVPGLLTRMGAQRCQMCCRRTGMPQGVGSPKNDDACRPLVEKRLAELAKAD